MSEIAVVPSSPPPRQFAERIALRLMQAGLVGVILAVTIHKSFELDRFLIPKELALHLTAAAAGFFALRAFRRVEIRTVDLLLIAYLLMSAMSALLATNTWLGLRALAVSVSAVAVFWIARALRTAGYSRGLLAAVALATVVAAITSLLQTYGVETELFSINRAPGGTLGNRNFVGHIAAFGLPVVLLAALHATRVFGFLIGALGAGIVSATLVLTRSRAAWLAAAAALGLLILALVFSRALRRDGRTWGRFIVVLGIAIACVAAALMIPNTLRWRSDNPYLDSVVGVANYEQGSGRGRLVQYERSLRMTLSHPLFGVGPGNWPAVYPEFAARNDPSLDPSDGMTFNPWPSSDWVGFLSERGPIGFALLALAVAVIALSTFRRIFAAETAEESLLATALLGTLVAAVLAGAFDAVLLLGAPALLVWTTVGALWPLDDTGAETPRTIRSMLLLLTVLVSAAGAVRSGGQIAAMEMYAIGGRETLERASLLDPGNYKLHMRLARSGNRKQRCEHARAAHELFPNAEAARELARRCE